MKKRVAIDSHFNRVHVLSTSEHMCIIFSRSWTKLKSYHKNCISHKIVRTSWFPLKWMAYFLTSTSRLSSAIDVAIVFLDLTTLTYCCRQLNWCRTRTWCTPLVVKWVNKTLCIENTSMSKTYFLQMASNFANSSSTRKQLVFSFHQNVQNNLDRRIT